MEPHVLKAYAMILSIIVRVEGMKSENQIRIMQDEALAYSEKDFFDAANKIETYAKEM